MGFKTPLYETHVAAGARMVDFGGWDMPVHLRLADRRAPRRAPRRRHVRRLAHAASPTCSGARVRDFLRQLLANDVAKLKDAGQGALQLHAQRATAAWSTT